MIFGQTEASWLHQKILLRRTSKQHVFFSINIPINFHQWYFTFFNKIKDCFFYRQTLWLVLTSWFLITILIFPFLNSMSRVFEVTYSHFSILGFWWISMISEFSFLGIGFITKTWKSRKIFIFWFITLQCMWILVLTTILTVRVIKLTKTKTGSI